MSALKGAADSGDEEETSSDKGFRFSSSSEVDERRIRVAYMYESSTETTDEGKPALYSSPSSSDVDDGLPKQLDFPLNTCTAPSPPSPPSSPSSPDAKTSTKTYQFSGPMEVASNCAYAYKTVNKNVWKRNAMPAPEILWLGSLKVATQQRKSRLWSSTAKCMEVGARRLCASWMWILRRLSSCSICYILLNCFCHIYSSTRLRLHALCAG